MAVTPGNRLIVREGQRLAANKLLATNHLNAFLEEGKPQVFDSVIKTIFTQRQIMSNPITELTEGRSKVKYLTGQSDSWTWKMAIASVCARVTENVESSNTTPGIDRLPFKIKLDQEWFSQGEVITPDKNKQVRISSQTKPYKDGNGWVYTVELVTDDATEFLDSAFLAPGTEWISIYSMYGEGATQASGVHFDSHIELENSMPDMVRMQHQMTGYVQDMVLTVENWQMDGAGNPVVRKDVKWIGRAEVELWKQFNAQKENSLFYGRGSSDIKSDGGHSLKTPYGFKQQLEWGNNETYNTFSLKLLREFFGDMFRGRVDMGNRNIVMLTGEDGFTNFNNAIAKEANGFLPFVADKVITGSGMNLGFGMQYKSYTMPNGGTLTLKYLPSLDTKVTNSMRNTQTGNPIDSSTYYVLDLSGEGADNIQMVKREDSLHYGYVIGSRAPWSLKGQVISNTMDGYTMIARDRVGLHIEDITKTAVLRPAV